MPKSSRSPSRWFWILTLIAMLVVVIVWFMNPLGEVERAPTVKETGQSTEWAPAPEGPAVDVTLPQTPMTNVPVRPTQAPDD